METKDGLFSFVLTRNVKCAPVFLDLSVKNAFPASTKAFAVAGSVICAPLTIPMIAIDSELAIAPFHSSEMRVVGGFGNCGLSQLSQQSGQRSKLSTVVLFGPSGQPSMISRTIVMVCEPPAVVVVDIRFHGSSGSLGYGAALPHLSQRNSTVRWR